MNMRIILFVLAFTLISTDIVKKIDVLYESLCPFCQDLIKNSFKKFVEFQDHDQLAILNFVPFGNAYDHWDESKQQWVTECQHGPQECVGNLIEACAKKKLEREAFYKFILCFENKFKGNNDGYEISKECSPDQGDDINTCALGKEGNELLHEASLATPDSIEYTPWLLINGKHDPYAERDIQDSLVDYLCQDRKDLPSCDKHIEMKELNRLAMLATLS
jgi:interferon gamma-inducible protein 30